MLVLWCGTSKSSHPMIFPFVKSQLFDLLLTLLLILQRGCFINFSTRCSPPTSTNRQIHQMEPLHNNASDFVQRCRYNYIYSHINAFWQAATLLFILQALLPSVCMVICMCLSRRNYSLKKMGILLQSKWTCVQLCAKFKSAFHSVQIKAELVVIMNNKLKLLTVEADRTKRGIIGAQVCCRMLN